MDLTGGKSARKFGKNPVFAGFFRLTKWSDAIIFIQ